MMPLRCRGGAKRAASLIAPDWILARPVRRSESIPAPRAFVEIWGCWAVDGAMVGVIMPCSAGHGRVPADVGVALLGTHGDGQDETPGQCGLQDVGEPYWKCLNSRG